MGIFNWRKKKQQEQQFEQGVQKVLAGVRASREVGKAVEQENEEENTPWSKFGNLNPISEGDTLFLNPSEKNKTRFSSTGEIIEENQPGEEEIAISDLGERYFRRNGEEYFQIGGENVQVKSPNPKLKVVNEYLNCLSDMGDLNLPKKDSEEVVIREGKIPQMKKIGETHEYSGYHSDLNNGRKIIIVDERLPEEAKIAVAFHEFVHARGIYDEKQTQLLTIQGLRSLDQKHEEIEGDERSWRKWFSPDADPDILTEEGHNKKLLRGATNYAIKARKSFDIEPSDIRKKLRKQ